MANPPYHPVKDFSAVAVFAYSSTSIVVNPSVPARTLRELIDYAKANPGKLSYGSAGNGSITNLAGELFKLRAGALDIVHVPYKGIGQGVSDLIGGQIPVLSANATAQILDLHRAGKVRILSVNSQTPIRSAPDIPTSIDAGLQGMVAQTTFGIFAPAGTSRSILDRINAVTQQAMSDQQFQAELIRIGFEPVLDVGPDKAAADKDLEGALRDAKQELWKVRFDLATRQESNYSKLPATRKRIARILTVMTERQHAADAAAVAEKAS